ARMVGRVVPDRPCGSGARHAQGVTLETDGLRLPRRDDGKDRVVALRAAQRARRGAIDDLEVALDRGLRPDNREGDAIALDRGERGLDVVVVGEGALATGI